MPGAGKEWAVTKLILTGDTGKTIMPAPSVVTKSHYVTRWHVTILTAAAQTFDLEDTSGTVEVAKFPASLAAGSYPGPTLPDEAGIKLTAGEALKFTPAGAGVGAFITAAGYTL